MDILQLFDMTFTGKWKTAGNNTQYCITESNDCVYLAFQGSVQKVDWFYNFMFFIKPYHNMPKTWYAHKGFTTAWKLAKEQIAKEVIDKLLGRKLVILGYSHGAAIAILAHEYFLFNGLEPETHAFGCPRVLWMPRKIIKERFANCHLYKNRGDIVTMVPPWIFGYRHVGKISKHGPCRFPSHIPHLDYEETLA